MLELHDLHLEYAAKGPVLSNLQARWPGGQVIGLVGPNGSGKSSLLRSVAQLLPYRGQIRLDGQDLRKLSPADRAQRLSYSPQQAAFTQPFSVREVVLMSRYTRQTRWGGVRQDDHRAALQALERVGAVHLAERPASALSGGEAQRVRLAQALTQGADWLLLDEPTSALDLHQQVESLNLFRELRAEGRSLLVVLHDFNLARQLCDQLCLLHAGQIVVQASPDEVLSHVDFQRVFQVRMDYFHNANGESVVAAKQIDDLETL